MITNEIVTDFYYIYPFFGLRFGEIKKQVTVNRKGKTVEQYKVEFTMFFEDRGWRIFKENKFIFGLSDYKFEDLDKQSEIIEEILDLKLKLIKIKNTTSGDCILYFSNDVYIEFFNMRTEKPFEIYIYDTNDKIVHLPNKDVILDRRGIENITKKFSTE